MKGRARLGLLALVLAGCGGKPPTYTTTSGIEVWDPAGHFSPGQVERLAGIFLDEFQQRWPADKARKLVATARIEFVDVHTYDSYGTTVAGTTDPQTLTITVAARDYRLSSCALAHELVHYVDMGLTGTTDYDHVSWKTDGTYDGLTRISQTMRLYELPAAERAQ